MGVLESFILSIFDSTMVIIFVHTLVKKLKTQWLNKILYIILTAFFIAVFSKYMDNMIISHIVSTAIGMLMLLLYLWFQDYRNIASGVLIFLMTSLLLMVLQLVSIVILNIALGGVEYTFINGITSQIITIIALMVLVKFMPISSIYIFIEDKKTVFCIGVMILFFIYYYVSILWYVDISHLNEAIISLVVIILFTIVINIIILRDGLLSRVYRERLQVYDTYFPVIDDIVEEFRKHQHDFHNHIQTIVTMKRSEFCSDRDIDLYIRKMNKSNIWSELLKIENKVIVAFIYSKYVEAQDKGIQYHFHIENYSLQSKYYLHELVEMYGILLDNALEATYSYGKVVDIDIYLKKEDGKNVFEVRNPYKYISIMEINNFFKKGFSTKEIKNHGIGLHKVKCMVEKKKGTISFYYDTSINRVIARLDHN